MNSILYYFLLSILLYVSPLDSFAVEKVSLEVVSPMKRVFKATEVTNQEKPIIELWAARNEYESAQIALRSESDTVIKGIEISDLVNVQQSTRIPLGSMEIRIPEYVFVQRNTKNTPANELDAPAPEWFPDPLLEFHELKFNGTRSLWLTFYVPENTPPGDYAGKMTIHINDSTRFLPIVLHVWNFTLPRTPSFFVTNWLHISQVESQFRATRYSKRFWEIIENIAKDMSAHRQNVIFTPLCLIKSIKHADGSYSFDFSNYERWVDIFQRNGFQAFEGSHLLHIQNSYDLRHGTKLLNQKYTFDLNHFRTDEGKQYLRILLTALDNKNKELAIADKYLQHIGDETKPQQWPLYQDIAALAHQCMAKVTIIDAVSMPVTEVQHVIDLPVPLLGKPLTPNPSSLWGKWWYICVNPQGHFPNRFVDYPLFKSRIIPWLSWEIGINGFLHYGYNFWYTPSKDSPWNDIDQSGTLPPGDGFIVYPPHKTGSTMPVSSLRWEIWREAAEDYEYLHLLSTLSEHQSAKDASHENNLRVQKQLTQSRIMIKEIRGFIRGFDDYWRISANNFEFRCKVGSLLSECLNNN